MTTVKVLLCCTGSVATIKLGTVLRLLLDSKLPRDDTKGDLSVEQPKFEVKVILTEKAKHFLNSDDLPSAIEMYSDSDEWEAWNGRGDPVLHIELTKWADILVIAPLDANTMGKIANGLCDNLLTCAVRAWDLHKPLIFCPAMNTKMWTHPITAEHVAKLRSWGYIEVPCISKLLMCGDTGLGAMAEPESIVAAAIKKASSLTANRTS
ncbi:unnamed protein product [Nesidiocoris tenuis]|uniref:Phosphopantothenoylcysteine decarboxylase n=1 Tax=Nesidiocoris tenuis TaxID=355587 RepID=A0A6H5HEI5_9HEMI|nr:unnamed protein product [Nesidiocoris tenuis]